jgi:hypothetical protein
MMTFEQACAWLRAGGGVAAYCYAPWMERRRWIGLQHCSIHTAGANDGWAIRLHGLAVGSNEWKPLHAGPLGALEALSTAACKAVHSVDPRDYLYAGCEGGAVEPPPRPPDHHGGLATGLYVVQRCLAHRPRLHAAASTNPGENSAAIAPARRLTAA